MLGSEGCSSGICYPINAPALPLVLLPLMLMLLIFLARGLIRSAVMKKVLTPSVRTPPGLDRWVDLYASADLVPERFVEVPLPMLRSYERIVCLAWNPRLLRLRPGLEKVVNTFAAALTKLEPAAGQSSNRRSRATGSVV